MPVSAASTQRRVQPVGRPLTVIDRAVQEIRQRIESGEFAPGSRLPTERQLAEQLSISRPSAREVFRALEAIGLVWRRVGSGTFVAHPADPTTQLLLSGDENPMELYEARLALEPRVAELAAYRRTPGDIMALRAKHHQAIECPKDTRERAARLLEFHIEVANASHNSVFESLVTSLGRQSEERLWRIVRSKHLELYERRNAADEHERILNAIESGNRAAARRAMTVHLEYQISVLLPSGSQESKGKLKG